MVEWGRLYKKTITITVPGWDRLYHKSAISLAQPVLGQKIIDEMQAMAKEAHLIYQSETNPDGSLKVGFSSKYEYEHIAILTGKRLNKAELQPDMSYDRIAVGSNDWGGMLCLVGYERMHVVDAVNKIAADLEARIK
jgi:hypothetical protein